MICVIALLKGTPGTPAGLYQTGPSENLKVSTDGEFNRFPKCGKNYQACDSEGNEEYDALVARTVAQDLPKRDLNKIGDQHANTLSYRELCRSFVLFTLPTSLLKYPDAFVSKVSRSCFLRIRAHGQKALRFVYDKNISVIDCYLSPFTGI